MLPFSLVYNFALFPCFGEFVGYLRCPIPGDGRISWKRIRFRTRTLMLIVAYIAILCAMAVLTSQLGRNANLYFGKYSSSEAMAQLFRKFARKAGVEGPMRLENAAHLRDGEDSRIAAPV